MTIKVIGRGFTGGMYLDENGNLTVNYAFQYADPTVIYSQEVPISFLPSSTLSTVTDAINNAVIDYLSSNYGISVVASEILGVQTVQQQM
jgi:hypothetical protein